MFCSVGTFAQDYFTKDSWEKMLCLFVQSDDIENVRLCLNRGANVNSFDENGYTPIMYAADRCVVSIVKLLMDNGADPNFRPIYDEEPPALHASVLRNNPSVVDLFLLYENTDVNFKDSLERTALYYAVNNGFLECADVLLYHGANPNFASPEATPLQIATYYNDTATIRLLLDYKANVNQVLDNKTAFSVAIQQGNITAAKYLLARGADSKLAFPQFYGAAYSDSETLKFLDSLSCDLKNVDPSSGISPMDLALKLNNCENVKYLRHSGAKPSYFMHLGQFSFSEINEVAKYEGRLGVKLGFVENRFNLFFNAGYAGRLFYKSTLYEKSPHKFYQIREKNQLFFLGLEKRLAIVRSQKYDFGGYLGYQFSSCFGKFDGAIEMKPKTEIFHSPTAGIYGRAAWFGFSVGYKYYDYKYLKQAPQNVVSFSFDFYLNRKLNYFKALTL